MTEPIGGWFWICATDTTRILSQAGLRSGSVLVCCELAASAHIRLIHCRCARLLRLVRGRSELEAIAFRSRRHVSVIIPRPGILHRSALRHHDVITSVWSLLPFSAVLWLPEGVHSRPSRDPGGAPGGGQARPLRLRRKI